MYQYVAIDCNALDSLPENGVLNNITTVDLENDQAEGQEVGIDLGPNHPSTDDRVYDENSEMSSFLPTNINRKTEKEVHDQFLDQTKKHEWHTGNEPGWKVCRLRRRSSAWKIYKFAPFWRRIMGK